MDLRPRESASIPVSGDAIKAKKDVEDVIRDLSSVVSGRLEREVLMLMRVEEITPVLHILLDRS